MISRKQIIGEITASRVAQHILFWLCIVSYFAFFEGHGMYFFRWVHILLYTLPIDIAFTYAVIYLYIPSYLFRKRYFTFAALIVFSLLFVLIIERLINYYIALPVYFSNYELRDTLINWRLFYHASDILIVILYASIIKLVKYWFVGQKREEELQIKQRESELALLRSQINPHFLFNTLNNIYSLVSRKSDEAPAAVMKLSELMRYMLYDASAEKVALEKEIEYLRSFIDLQELRLSRDNFVELTILNNAPGKQIAPMLLIPFVENSFKHGSKKVNGPGIFIRLETNDNFLIFEISNFFRPDEGLNKDVYRGIGLNNVRRRLELLYPGKHELNIGEGDGQFKVRLSLTF